MTVNISRFADYQGDKAPLTTHLLENHDLTVMVDRGGAKNPAEYGSSWDGIVLIRSEVDDEDYAVVELQAGSSQGDDSLATIKLVMAHFTAVRDRLRAVAAIEDGS